MPGEAALFVRNKIPSSSATIGRMAAHPTTPIVRGRMSPIKTAPEPASASTPLVTIRMRIAAASGLRRAPRSTALRAALDTPEASPPAPGPLPRA